MMNFRNSFGKILLSLLKILYFSFNFHFFLHNFPFFREMFVVIRKFFALLFFAKISHFLFCQNFAFFASERNAKIKRNGREIFFRIFAKQFFLFAGNSKYNYI